jgi:sialate O-acetylesterase
MRNLCKQCIQCSLFFLLLVVGNSEELFAELRLPAIFGDQMVLQQKQPVTIWGWAKAGEKIRVEFAGQKVETTAGKDTRWQLQIAELDASFEAQTLVVSGDRDTVQIKDVLVGEVWLCGGQSNMEMTMGGTVNRDLEIASADYDSIRFLRIPHVSQGEPREDILIEKDGDCQWQRCTTEFVAECTGVGYYFARGLHRILKVPVGIVDVSWGGTMAQHWVNEEKLNTVAEMKTYFADYNERLSRWNEFGGEAQAKAAYQAALAKWESDNAEALAKKERVAERPNAGQYENPARQRHPAGMYNGMIHPIRDFDFRGILFYQGENNSFGESWKPFYATFPLVIEQWRESFGDLPFGIIQIAGWSSRRTMTYDMNHHTNVIREIQFDTWQATQQTGLIATYDTNSNQGIHPGAKRPVGERSARWALGSVYGVKSFRSNTAISYLGPVYEGYEVQDNKVEIRFVKETCAGLRINKDDDVGFYIAGENGEFHHARARVTRVEGVDRLVVWSDEVPQPVAVRYAWSNLPNGRLMNSRELPAFPFRTDDWKMTPHQSEGDYQRGIRKP